MRRNVLLLAMIAAGIGVAGEHPEKFETRLAPVSMDVRMQANIAGSGSASAVLDGSRLTVSGSFEGLKSPATIAQLHEGRGIGVRGPAVFTLTISKAASGTISGVFDLSPEQIESVKQGHFYVQIHSEKAPDGNLWGWLLR